jgi:hypothetical protein
MQEFDQPEDTVEMGIMARSRLGRGEGRARFSAKSHQSAPLLSTDAADHFSMHTGTHPVSNCFVSAAEPVEAVHEDAPLQEGAPWRSPGAHTRGVGYIARQSKRRRAN